MGKFIAAAHGAMTGAPIKGVNTWRFAPAQRIRTRPLKVHEIRGHEVPTRMAQTAFVKGEINLRGVIFFPSLTGASGSP